MNDTIKACAGALAALAEIRKRKFLPIPKEWFSVDQFCEQHDCGVSFARSAMKSLFRAGKLDSQRWAIEDTAGRINYTTIYKLK